MPGMAPWSPVALPPRFVAARRTRLVGRRYELGVLETVWERVAQGAGQVLLVGGEPGAGKTRLAAETAGVLHEQGAAVLVGTATKDAGVPYQPFAEMLDHLFLASEPGTLDAAGELRLLSRHAARHLPDPAEPVGDGRRDLFEAVAELFRSIARDQPLVVVLDDLHWAQLPTVALLEHVVHSCLDTPTLVVATFRTTAPDRSDELSARLADLHRLDGVRRLDLAGLDTEAIAEFVCEHAGVSSAAARASAAILRDRTGGNPFFLRETWLDLERQRRCRGPARPATGARHARRHRRGPAGRPRGAPAGDRRAGRGDRRRVRPADAGRGRHGRPEREHGRGRRSGRGGPRRTGGRDRRPLRVRALADAAGGAGPAAAHPLHGAARPGGADAGGARRPRADAADRAPLPRRARPRLPRAGIAAHGGGAPGRPCTAWRSRRRRCGSTGPRPCRRRRRTSGRSCRSKPPRTTCARATSPGPGGSTSG